MPPNMTEVTWLAPPEPTARFQEGSGRFKPSKNACDMA